MTELSDLRHDNSRDNLRFDEMPANPIVAIECWLDEAIQAAYYQPNAMALSTVNEHGKPSSRIVLLKALSDEGLIFYTNYHSRKGHDISNNSAACGLFYHDQLERQIRVEGTITKAPTDLSDAYFSSRPRASQIGAVVSPQSEVIDGTDTLHAKFKQLEEETKDQDIPRPKHWGGYILKPEKIEFWQGRPSRLHDRLLYTKVDDNWTTQVLAP